MRSEKKVLLVIILFFLAFNSCKKNEAVSSMTLSRLQNRWFLSSRTMFSIAPPISNVFPGIYDRYIGTASDSYNFNTNGLVDISEYNINSTLKYSLSNDTMMGYAQYNLFTWPTTDNPIIIKVLTENLLVLSYPTYGHFSSNNMVTLDYIGVRLDSLNR